MGQKEGKGQIMAQPMKTLELHYSIILFFLIAVNSMMVNIGQERVYK